MSHSCFKASAFAETLCPPSPDAEDEAEREGDFSIDEEKNTITLTETGISKALTRHQALRQGPLQARHQRQDRRLRQSRDAAEL